MDDDIRYHARRALAELDLARTCPDGPAARAHLDRAAEHIASLRQLNARTSPDPRPLPAA